MKVHSFKQDLQTEGVLHWDFADIDQFEKLVTLHITRHVQSWRHRQQREPAILTNSSDSLTAEQFETTPSNDTSTDDDDGLLDLVETFEERIAEVTNIMTRLTDAQHELSSKTNLGAAELQTLQAAPEGASAKQARRLIAKVADEMNQFTARTDAEIPLFRAAMNSSMAALTKAAALSVAFDVAQTQSARAGALTLLTSLPGARESIIAFKAATVGLPRITKELNLAKRTLATAIDALIAEFESAERLIAEVISVIDALLDGPSQ